MEVLLNTPSVTLSVEELTTLASLEALRTDWAALWKRCSAATPFQTPEWLIAWWKHLGHGQLWVLAFRHQTRLVAVAPLLINHEPPKGREALFLGTGVTDYLDILSEPELEALVSDTLLAHLHANSDLWDHCDFQQLRGGSPLLRLRWPEPWASEIMVQEVCPVLTLPEHASELPEKVPAHTLSRLGYYRRRISRLFAVTMERASGENFFDLFESFVELHTARWSARGQNGVLASPSLHRFHAEAARGFLASGNLRLYGLRIGRKIAASLYAFSGGGRAFYYLSGFAPELAPLNPGTIMIGHAIEEAIQEGHTEFDFLRGREAYKYLWGAKGRLNYRCRLAQR